MPDTKQPTRLKDLGTRTDAIKLDPRIIVIEEGHNPRDYKLAENRAHLDNLKASIRQIGVRQPLWVRWEAATKQVILVGGECRLRSCLELIAEGHEIESVPVIQVQGNNEAERVRDALTENSGKPLSQWEAGVGYKRLIAFGWSVDRIAAECAVTTRYVSQAIELTDVPEQVKEQLSAGQITPAVAVKSVREHGSNAGKINAERIAEADGKPLKRERAATGSGNVLQAAKVVLSEVTPADWDAKDEWVSISYDALTKLYAAVNKQERK